MSAPNYPVTDFIQRSATQYNFVPEDGSSVLQSPALVQGDNQQNALRLTCDLSGNTSIGGTAVSSARTLALSPNGSGVGDVLVVRENPSTGQGFVQIGNSAGTTVSIVGNTAANAQCVIQASGAGTIQLGANGVSYDNLTLNADHTVSLSRAPVLAYGLAGTVSLAQVDHSTNALVSIPAGAQSPGLYCILVQTATSNNVSDAPAHMSVNYYYDGTQIVAGGAVSGPTQVGGPAGAYSILPYASAGVFNQFNFVNTSAGSAVTPTIRFLKLAGPIAFP